MKDKLYISELLIGCEYRKNFDNLRPFVENYQNFRSTDNKKFLEKMNSLDKNEFIELCDNIKITLPDYLRNKYSEKFYYIDQCRKCNNFFLSKLNGRHLCFSCEHGIYKCNICKKMGSYDELTSLYFDELICLKCASVFDYCLTCSRKSNWYSNEGYKYKGITCLICYYCSSNFFKQCSNCHYFSTFKIGVDDYCDFCYLESVSVKNNWYKPQFLDFISHNDDNTKLFLGIELEIELVSNMTSSEVGYERNYVYKRSIIAKEIMKNFPMLYVKHDGSLRCGIEIVSSPMTYNFIIKEEETFLKLFDYTKSINLKARATCGMHIHLSRCSFTQAHLLKFIKIVNENFEFIRTFTRRTRSSLQRFADVRQKNYKDIISSLRQNISRKYSSVNFGNKDTVELRIFKGVDKFDDFIRNIEFTKSLYDFTKKCTFSENFLKNYISFIMENNEFNTVKKWLKSKRRNELVKSVLFN
jgi:hypothetical protein